MVIASGSLESLATGAVCGAVVGLLLGMLSFWAKDRRDARLRAAGAPLPADRVWRRLHPPLISAAAIVGAILSVLARMSHDS